MTRLLQVMTDILSGDGQLAERLRSICREKYETQTEAAIAWGVSQSAVSLLLSGKRNSRKVLRRIAKAEGISVEDLVNAPSPGPQLVLSKAGGARFVYDLENPHQMLMQVQHWFSDLPEHPRVKNAVARAVMRTLFDESFNEIHRPTKAWFSVMRSIEGWAVTSGARTASQRRAR